MCLIEVHQGRIEFLPLRGERDNTLHFPTVFPSDADMKKMQAPDALSNDIRRTMTRLYTSFKTGL